MKLWHSIIIGACVVLGFIAHGLITAWPDKVRIERGHDMQTRLMEVTPKEVELGEENLLYLPRISYRDTSIDVSFEFYVYEEDRLRQVALTRE